MNQLLQPKCPVERSPSVHLNTDLIITKKILVTICQLNYKGSVYHADSADSTSQFLDNVHQTQIQINGSM